MIENLEMLLEDMVSDVVEQRHLPLDEIRSWRWSRLRRTHRQVRKAQWDKFIAGIREVETGVGRGLYPMFGKGKVGDLPTFDKVAGADIFTLTDMDTEDNSWMKRYLEANNLSQ